MTIKYIDPKKITIKDRFREDLGNLSELVLSIKEKGFIQPIVVDKGEALIAGHRRLTAALECGLTKIPCVVVNPKDEIDSREIELLENIARKDFTWYERAALEKRIMDLKKELDPSWNIKDQAVYMGTSHGAVHRRLALASVIEAIPELADSKTEDEAWKKYKKLQEDVVLTSMRDDAGSRYEDAIRFAADHYEVGDALIGLKKIQPGTVSFIEVDPPYGISITKVKGGRKKDRSQLDHYNEVPHSEYPQFLMEVATQCYRILADDYFCVFWFGPVWYSHVYSTLCKVGFKVNPVPAIWYKTQFPGQTASPDTSLGSSYEMFLVARKGDNAKLCKPGRSNVFEYKPVPPQDKIHPTERPIELMDELYNTFCWPGSIVCVPFLGSGVSLRAAYRRDCTGYGWDLDALCKERFLNSVYRDKMKEG